MHIAVVCRGLGAGGSVAAVALRQSLELSRRARVTLVSDSLPADTPWAGRELLRVPDLHALRRFRHIVDEYVFVRAARQRLFRLHAQSPVGFVLCHAHAVAALSAAPFRARTGVPFGMFVHGDIFDRPKGTYDPRITRFYQHVTPRAYREADVVFALAPFFVELALQRGGSAERIEVSPNGIDPADIGISDEAPPLPRGEGEPLRALFAGRLAVEKGVEYLLEACARVRGNIALDVVGSGVLERELRERAASLGLGARVSFRPPAPRRELGAVYRAHHLFCLPSTTEPFSVALLEALAAGLPVIASNVGGVPVVVEPEHNGLLVPPADPAALAHALDRLAADDALRLRLAANARSSVLPRFRWEAIGDQLASRIERAVLR